MRPLVDKWGTPPRRTRDLAAHMPHANGAEAEPGMPSCCQPLWIPLDCNLTADHKRGTPRGCVAHISAGGAASARQPRFRDTQSSIPSSHRNAGEYARFLSSLPNIRPLTQPTCSLAATHALISCWHRGANAPASSNRYSSPRLVCSRIEHTDWWLWEQRASPRLLASSANCLWWHPTHRV